MELFTFLFTEKWMDDAETFLRMAKSHFKHKYSAKEVQTQLKKYKERTEVIVKYKASEEGIESFIQRLSWCVSDYVVSRLEPYMMEQLIRLESGYEDEQDIEEMKKYSRHLLYEQGETEEDRMHALNSRKAKIAEESAEYLREHRYLHILGWIRFRAYQYRDQLKDVVEYAVDEFVMERQYQDFINLLKYFVYVQEAKIPLVHLVHKGNYDFVVLDENLEPIKAKQIESMVVEMLDQDLNYEDMIVSTLINVSPQMIYIHTKEPELQVIKTIQQIFEKRAVLCQENVLDTEPLAPKPLQLH
ncbi:putative sporulation protein YtxC [Marinicrinis lubricantis]|uniref:Sporulation protein YtxC n=1 Tax=Marinicrinis lubricantis TaxID=2086470 RepID=A0ABW1ILV0_9BACL